MGHEEDQAIRDLQKLGTWESLRTFSQVGERFDPWKFQTGKCLDPNRMITRQPGMLNNERMGL